MIYRQGDVLLVKVKELPAKAKEAKTEETRIVLAYGEVTGHAHAIALPAPARNAVAVLEKPKAKLWDAGAERFLQILEKTALTHEEHAPIPLDPGVYKVVRQKEYDPDAERFARMVAD